MVPGARPANSRTRRPVKGGGAVIVNCLDYGNNMAEVRDNWRWWSME